MKFLVVGESCRDIFHYGNCTRICPEAPVPIFNSVELKENGGMAKNVQRNLIALGCKANLCTNKNWRSITKTRFIDVRSNHMFMRLDVNDEQIQRSKLKSVNFSTYSGIIISDYNKGFLTEEDIEYISNQHDNTFLDTKKILGDWCKNIGFIKINNEEFDKSRKLINDKIYNKMIVTLGPDGSMHNDVIYPVPLVEIKDPSGAGDTFVAAFAKNFTENKNIEKAIRFANECATQVVQKKGVNTV